MPSTALKAVDREGSTIIDSRAHPLLRFIISFYEFVVIELSMIMNIVGSGKFPASALNLTLISYKVIIQQSYVQFKMTVTYALHLR